MGLVLCDERWIESIVIKGVNQFCISQVQLLKTIIFLLEPRVLIQFGQPENFQNFSKNELIDNPEELKKTNCLPFEAVFTHLHNNKHFEKDYLEFENFLGACMEPNEKLLLLNLGQIPPNGQEKCH